jgi:hypothetical protein
VSPTSTSNARVDGHDVAALAPERIAPINGKAAGRARQTAAARERARIERQTGLVHASSTSGVLRRWLAWQVADAERGSIRAELVRAGLL